MGAFHLYEKLGLLLFLTPLMLTLIALAANAIAEGIRGLARRRREEKRGLVESTPGRSSLVPSEVLRYIKELAEKSER